MIAVCRQRSLCSGRISAEDPSAAHQAGEIHAAGSEPDYQARALMKDVRLFDREIVLTSGANSKLHGIFGPRDVHDWKLDALRPTPAKRSRQRPSLDPIAAEADVSLVAGGSAAGRRKLDLWVDLLGYGQGRCECCYEEVA